MSRTFRYNRQSEVIEIEDQQGTIHSFDHDALGRQTQDRDDSDVGRTPPMFQCGGDPVGVHVSASVSAGTLKRELQRASGSVVNEVQFAYNDFGQPTTDYQAHGATVNTSTTPKVQYGYANGSANTIRPTTITYPDGREIAYGYGTADGMNDAISRIESIVDDDVSSTHLADYSYLGLGPARGLLPTVNSPFTPGAIEADYTEPDIKYTFVGTTGGTDSDTGDIYRGFDRFGRIKDSYWYDYGSSADIDRIKYGYDRNGSRLWRENTVAASYSKDFDELYGYDLIDRLQEMARGSLDSGHSTLDPQLFRQDWSLDATGNWRNFCEDDDGDGSWDLNQQRSANKVNEISDISETTGPSWVTPIYNRAGNMTTIPKPSDPTISFTATYDAWNRLVKIEDGENTIAEYEFDGAKRRIIKKTYDVGTLDETRHLYYTEPSRWQVIEERTGTSTDAERQFVWGLRYIDDIVLRDRDTTADGTLDERLYGMQDANWNVTSVASATGAVQERYSYEPYGNGSVLTGTFAHRSSSPYDTDYRFTGRRFDHEMAGYSYRERIYCSNLGVFLRRDTFSGFDVHRYLYVVARPTQLVDPSGRFFLPPVLTAMHLCCREHYSRTKDEFNPPLGVTLCCGHLLMVICVHTGNFNRYGITDPQAIDIVKNCVYEHEKIHTKQCRCTLKTIPGYRCINQCEPLRGYERKNVRECLAFERELACLKQHEADCGSNTLCHEQIGKHIRNYVEEAMRRFSCEAILRGMR